MPEVTLRTADKATRCPWCDYEHQAVSSINVEELPEDGDISLCINCVEWCIFDSRVEGGLRKPTYEEYDSMIVRNEDATRLREAMLQVKNEQ